MLEKAFGLSEIKGFDENLENPPDGLKIKDREIRGTLKRRQRELFQCVQQEIPGAAADTLDGISIQASRAICDGLRIRLTAEEADRPKLMYTKVTAVLNKEGVHYNILEKYIGPYLSKCTSIYADYHKWKKRNYKLPEDILERINKDWNELGASFRIIFPDEENLFNQRNILEVESDENDTPVEISLDDDYHITIEKYQNCVKRGHKITDSNILEKVEEAYWEIDQVEESREIITQSIKYYHEQQMRIDKATWLKIYAERLKEKEDWGNARNKYDEALKIIEEFGRDRTYAKVRNDKILCEIESISVVEFDREYKLWLPQLTELQEIFKNWGDLRSMNRVQLNEIRIYCKLGDIKKALNIIEGNVGNDFLSKKYEAEFYHDCASIFLRNKSRIDEHEEGMKINAKKLLEKSMEMYKEGGEISGIIKILNTKLKYEDNKYNHEKIEKEIDELKLITQKIDSKADEDIDEDFISHLIDEEYWEGLRRFVRGENGTQYVEWLRDQGLEQKDYFKFVGNEEFYDFSYKVAKVCINRGDLERGLVHLNHAIGMKRNIEREKGVKLNMFEAMILEQHYYLKRLKYKKIYHNYSYNELKNKLGTYIPRGYEGAMVRKNELIALLTSEAIGEKPIKKIIDMWGKLDSKRGVWRWKKMLARNFLSFRNKKEAEEIYKEGLEFYKDKDASKYFHFKAELISISHYDEERESSQEWVELLNDQYIPNNWDTKCEILYRLTIQYELEKKYEKALENSQKVIEILKEDKKIGIQRRKYISIEKAVKKREMNYLIELNMFDKAFEKVEEYYYEGTFDKGHKLDIKYKILEKDNDWNKMVSNRLEKINHRRQKDYPYQEELEVDVERDIIQIINIYKNHIRDNEKWGDMRKFLYGHQKKHNLQSDEKLMEFANNLLKVEENKGEHKSAYKYREDVNEYISNMINGIDDRVINSRSIEYPYKKIEIEYNEQLGPELNQIREQEEKKSLITKQGENNWAMAKLAARIANKEDDPYKSYHWNHKASECISRNLEKLKKGILNVLPGEKVHAEKYEIYLKEAAESALKIAKSFQNKGGMEANKGMDWRRKRYGHLEKISDDITIDLEEEYSEVLELYRDLLKKMEEEEYSKGNIKKVKTDMEQFVKKYGIEKRD